MEESHDVRVARLEERVNSLKDGHDEIRGIVSVIRDDISTIKERLAKVDVKQVLTITVFGMIMNGTMLYLINHFGR